MASNAIQTSHPTHQNTTLNGVSVPFQAGITEDHQSQNPDISTDSDSNLNLVNAAQDYLAKDTDRSHLEDIDRSHSVPRTPQDTPGSYSAASPEQPIASQVSSNISPDSLAPISPLSQEAVQDTASAIRPEPIVAELRREPERILLETVYLVATDPTRSQSPVIHLQLYLENCCRDTELQIDLLTNNESGPFLSQVVSQHFGEGYGIYGCDRL